MLNIQTGNKYIEYKFEDFPEENIILHSGRKVSL